MKSLITSGALILALAFGDSTQAQNPARGNGVNGIYTAGVPIQGVYIQGAPIRGVYIAPPSSIPRDYQPQPFRYTWTQNHYYPGFSAMPNYSSVYPTRYGP